MKDCGRRGSVPVSRNKVLLSIPNFVVTGTLFFLSLSVSTIRYLLTTRPLSCDSVQLSDCVPSSHLYKFDLPGGVKSFLL